MCRKDVISAPSRSFVTIFVERLGFTTSLIQISLLSFFLAGGGGRLASKHSLSSPAHIAGFELPTS